jgi:Rrf2 family protein
MATLISKSSQYAIQAVMYVARAAHQRALVHVKEISNVLHIPHHFLGKILQTLSRHGILASQKGLKGGFSLARLPEQITLMDIIEAVDGEAFRTECFFGFPGCGESTPCSIHELWSDTRTKILDSLRRTTIADLSSELETRMNITVSQSSPAQQEQRQRTPFTD